MLFVFRWVWQRFAAVLDNIRPFVSGQYAVFAASWNEERSVASNYWGCGEHEVRTATPYIWTHVWELVVERGAKRAFNFKKSFALNLVGIFLFLQRTLSLTTIASNLQASFWIMSKKKSGNSKSRDGKLQSRWGQTPFRFIIKFLVTYNKRTRKSRLWL